MKEEESKIVKISVELSDGSKHEINNGFCCEINPEEESANWYITEQTELQDVALYSHSLVGSLLTDAEWDDNAFSTIENEAYPNEDYTNKQIPSMT